MFMKKYCKPGWIDVCIMALPLPFTNVLTKLCHVVPDGLCDDENKKLYDFSK